MVAPGRPSAPGSRFGAKSGVLECVVNVSEGRDDRLVRSFGDRCQPVLLDVHSDPDHNRSVFTLAGAPEEVSQAVRQLAIEVTGELDIRDHSGVHPRFGVLDVVPWVGLEGWPLRDASEGSQMARAAEHARESFARWVASELGVPAFLYGPERSLPEVRRRAWRGLLPDFGPSAPHSRAGSVAVGLRPLLVAYNIWLAGSVNEQRARAVAASVRGPDVRALAFPVRGGYQVSCNLLAPFLTGPGVVYEQVSRLAPVQRAEVVGLVPRGVLVAVPKQRWVRLGLSASTTLESRLAERGLEPRS
jgi:glutamate formiminotransferase